MSWRSGSSMFLEFWPLIQRHLPERDDRIEFTADLLQLLVKNDMDTWDVEDVDADIRAAMRQSGIEIAEPERYLDDPSS